MNFKLTRDHDKDCAAVDSVVQGVWNNPWFITGETCYRTKSGQNRAKGNNTLWFYFQCNSPDCPAQGMVSHEFLCDALESEIVENRPFGVPAAKPSSGSSTSLPD